MSILYKERKRRTNSAGQGEKEDGTRKGRKKQVGTGEKQRKEWGSGERKRTGKKRGAKEEQRRYPERNGLNLTGGRKTKTQKERKTIKEGARGDRAAVIRTA